MNAEHGHVFTRRPHPAPVAADLRASMLEDPGFGRVFTDHMATIRWTWTAAGIRERSGPARLSCSTRRAPCCTTPRRSSRGSRPTASRDGGVVLFRPEQNARRFQASAERLAMPVLPEAAFLRAIEELVRVDVDWVPGGDGSLYLRPFMFASEAFLGVRPASEYHFVVIASPVGAYFKSGRKAVSVWLSADYTRAAPGGTGAAKCGGNYAASLVAQAEAIRQGCDQVVFLDAAERRWVEELGGMNVFFVFDDGSMLTPPLGGTILPGVTRDSIIELARRDGRTVREERYSYDEWRADAASGRLREAFACGTAAVVTPIGEIKSAGGGFVIGNGGGGPVAETLRAKLVGIQRGEIADEFGWVRRVV